jgi:hypothetical protein
MSKSQLKELRQLLRRLSMTLEETSLATFREWIRQQQLLSIIRLTSLSLLRGTRVLWSPAKWALVPKVCHLRLLLPNQDPWHPKTNIFRLLVNSWITHTVLMAKRMWMSKRNGQRNSLSNSTKSLKFKISSSIVQSKKNSMVQRSSLLLSTTCVKLRVNLRKKDVNCRSDLTLTCAMCSKCLEASQKADEV